MIFRFPLFRNGYYYMSKRTFREYKESEEAIEFNHLLKSTGAVITELPDYFKITISPDQIKVL